MGLKVVIAGGRDYFFTESDISFLNKVVSMLDIKEVLCGGAKGADAGGKDWALGLGISVTDFPAKWEAYGKMAGPVRNVEMAARADVVILFPGGRGTANMRERAHQYGCVVIEAPHHAEIRKENLPKSDFPEFIRGE